MLYVNLYEPKNSNNNKTSGSIVISLITYYLK